MIKLANLFAPEPEPEDITQVLPTKLPVTSVLAHGTVLQGSLTLSDGLKIDGEVGGDITINGNEDSLLVIGPRGIVHGSLTAPNIIVCGRVDGTVTASKALKLTDTAYVAGEVSYGSMDISEGATLDATSRKISRVRKPEQEPQMTPGTSIFNERVVSMASNRS